MILIAAGPWGGLAHFFGHPFLRDAFVAGTAIALASGMVGYFVVLRGQVFAGDAMSHVAFTGALGALAAGVGLLIGLYGLCVAVAVVMALLDRRGRPDDTVIGSVFAWILGLGALFLTLYTTSSLGTDAASGVNVLFGTIFGLSGGQALVDTAVCLGVVLVLVAIGRPLLFCTVDDAVARARGVPARPLGVLFLVLVGVTAGAAAQAVGALLLVGLLAAPAGAARRLTAKPFVALWLSAALAVLSTWVGLGVAYAAPTVPPSFGILATATAIYLLAFLFTAARERRATAARGIRGPRGRPLAEPAPK